MIYLLFRCPGPAHHANLYLTHKHHLQATATGLRKPVCLCQKWPAVPLKTRQDKTRQHALKAERREDECHDGKS